MEAEIERKSGRVGCQDKLRALAGPNQKTMASGSVNPQLAIAHANALASTAREILLSLQKMHSRLTTGLWILEVQVSGIQGAT
jgi:hypothetical protein